MRYFITLLIILLFSGCCSWAKKNCVDCQMKELIKIVVIKQSVINETCTTKILEDVPEPTYYVANENMDWITAFKLNIKVMEEYIALLKSKVTSYKGDITQNIKCIEDKKARMTEAYQSMLQAAKDKYKNQTVIIEE